MEQVLDVYQEAYDPEHPLICMDEASRQILRDLHEPLPMKPAGEPEPAGEPGAETPAAAQTPQPAPAPTASRAKAGTPRRVDDKYERNGTRSLILFYNPLDGWRHVGCRDSRTREDWAQEVRRLLEVDYPQAKLVTLVCDNLNTHDVASLYQAFDAETAGRLRRRLRLVYTPKNGSWLNMAEMELSILSRQCLGQRRFGSAAEMDAQIEAWEQDRNARRCGTDWRFTTADARVKLKSLYPKG